MPLSRPRTAPVERPVVRAAESLANEITRTADGDRPRSARYRGGGGTPIHRGSRRPSSSSRHAEAVVQRGASSEAMTEAPANRQFRPGTASDFRR